MAKGNGSFNGSGPHGEDDKKIVSFPSLAERRRKIMGTDKTPGKKSGKKDVPFFNFHLIPPFTRVIVVLLIAVQIVMTFLPDDLKMQIVFTFGFLPAYFSGAIKPFPPGAILSPVTHIFIHGGWVHLAFNSVMALALGMFFEREFGTRTTAVFFFVCGLAGALFYFILNPVSHAPVIGASGSVSGLFGALIVITGQRNRFGRFKGPWPLVGFWIVFMVGTGLLSGDALAWQAHIGGFLMGIGLLLLMQKKKIKF